MHDSFGREINYMRVSITDRCNLRCAYCMPHGIEPLIHADILRYEEILRICKAVAKLGIQTVKVTGGEPLVRKGCIEFLKALKFEVKKVTITTNGVLLEQYVPELAKMKIDGVNISLDSLNADVYKKITGGLDSAGDNLSAVLRSLNKTVEAGLHVKINCVPMHGINDTEIIPIARLAEKLPINVRFIERMPVTSQKSLDRVSGAEILARLKEEYPDLADDTTRRGFGPARYFKSGKMKGSVGIIDAIGGCFCRNCNRVRLTSNGFLKLCLFHGDGLNLRDLLREGADDFEIESQISAEIGRKPKQYQNKNIVNMPQIGG